uniref:Uncharacterized protein n=1 Tax=Gouania willdenowi TaxID=441366 RepID=A0A8C5HRJ5_GOUWI
MDIKLTSTYTHILPKHAGLQVKSMLLNNSDSQRCFQCCHSNSQDSDCTLFNDQVITFCEFVSVSWLTHVIGGVVRMLLDYVSHVIICSKPRQILERKPEWNEINGILSKIAPNLVYDALAVLPFPPGLKKYLVHREYKLQV